MFINSFAVSGLQTTVTFGLLSNFPFGSAYGYVASGGYFYNSSNYSGGSNPSPATISIDGNTFNHPYIADYTQYGYRGVRIEIDKDSNGANHPTTDWLTSLKIDDGAGNSNTIDTSDGYYRFNRVSSQYVNNGAYYSKGFGSNAPVVIDTTNNDKTLTWEFVL